MPKVGSAASTPGVSAQPGCSAWKWMPWSPNFSAQSSLRVTWARLASEYCFAPLYSPGRICRPSTVRLLAYIPPDDIVSTRDGADAAS